MKITKKPHSTVLLAALSLPLVISAPAFAEQGCPSDYIPSGNELAMNSSFANGYDGFSSDIIFQAAVGEYPIDNNGSAYPETGIGIVTGSYASADELVSQIPFPGDASAGVAAVDTWFAYNGNNDNSPTKMWAITLDNLEANTSYAFSAYFSNALRADIQAGQGYVAPLISFQANGTAIGDDIAVCDGGGDLAPLGSCNNIATEDSWQNLGVTLNSGNNSSLELSIHDAQTIQAGGNDFAFTYISVQECTPINVDPTFPDSDKDGITDNIDIDDDNDGILDVNEGGSNGDADFDGDGVVNRLDLDSDNDGIPDIREALGTDSDNDGRVDNQQDANNDGHHDDLSGSTWAEGQPDTDNDGARDFLDLDSDGDSLLDITEAGLSDSDSNGQVDNFTDPDGDGWDTSAKAATEGALPDENDNGIPDYREPKTAVAGDDDERGEVLTRLDGGVGSFGFSLLLPVAIGGLLRRRKRTAAAVLLASMSVIGSAHAEQGQFYVGGGIGASLLEPKVVNIPNLSVTETSDTGLKLFLGYDILDWLSIEGYGAKLGKAEFSDGSDIDYNVYGADLVVNLPNNSPGLSVLGKLGLAEINNSSDSVDYREVENLQVVAGIGAEYEFENQFSLRGEYEYFDKDAQLISLSLLKRFGNNEQVPVIIPPVTPIPEPIVIPEPAPEPVVIYTPEPEPIAVPQVQTIRLNIEPIYFDSDQAYLRTEAKASLSNVANLLQQYPNVSLIVVGHTDSRASDSYNMGLSLARAKNAAKHLESLGIASHRLNYEARGEASPASINDTPEGRQLNRRVEFFPTPSEVLVDYGE